MSIFDRLMGKKLPVDASWMGKAAMAGKPAPMAPAPSMLAPPPTVTPQFAPPETSGVSIMDNLPQMGAIKKPGVFDRIGDFIQSDEGRGALLRSGAATLQGGLGAGIAAGASWVDKRKEAAAGQSRFDQTFGLQEQGVEIDQQRVDQDGLAKAASIKQAAVNAGIDMAKLSEVIRKNNIGEQLDWSELKLKKVIADEGFNIDLIKEGGRNNRAILSEDGANSRAALTQDRTDERYYNPPLKDGGYTTTTSTASNEDGTVKSTVSKRKPNTVVRTQAQYDSLPVGAKYIDSKGQQATKR